jgi:hypothetical protein
MNSQVPCAVTPFFQGTGVASTQGKISEKLHSSSIPLGSSGTLVLLIYWIISLKEFQNTCAHIIY